MKISTDLPSQNPPVNMEIHGQSYQQFHSSQKPSQRLQTLTALSDSCSHKKVFPFPAPVFSQSAQHSAQSQTHIIKNIAGDFHFSKEVVSERGLASLTYSEWDAKGLYKAFNITPQLLSNKMLKICPFQQKSFYMKHALPIKQFKPESSTCFGNNMWTKSQEIENRLTMNSLLHSGEILKPKMSSAEELGPRSQSKRKAKTKSEVCASCVPPKDFVGWDEHVLKKLTKTTAQWIAGHYTDNRKLKKTLCKRDGLRSSEELIREERMTEEDFRPYKEQEKSREISDQSKEDNTTDTFLPVETPFPLLTKKEAIHGSYNKTAESLIVKHFEPAPSLRLQDLMNPKAGKHVCATENAFEGELYSGLVKIMHQKGITNKNHIIMESQNQYDKHLQELLPKSHTEWSTKDSEAGLPLRPERGAVRWIALPTPVLNKTIQTCELPVDPKPQGQTQPEKEMHLKLNKRQVLWNILTQWKSSWMLTGNWKETTLEQLKRDLHSVHKNSRISALVTIATSAVRQSMEEADAGNTEDMCLINNALGDVDALVRMAAALCCYINHSVSEEARKVMFSALEKGCDADSWAAAQCLALEGDHSYPVIKRIITQLFEVNNEETEEQARYMLRKLSMGTKLVHAMLGEALNNGNWRDRVLACRALSQLHGHGNQDLRNKLNYLMWEDWSPAVKQAAARSLGIMGCGKEIHDQLQKKLQCGTWKTKVEALSLIGWLRLMTAQLLPEFLQCFSDEFAAVRKQACLAAGLLQIRDDVILSCLCDLIQSDSIWKIQASAVKAIGNIGHVTPRVKEILMWAVHHGEPGVRIEAFHCIALLRILDPDMQYMLRDKLMLESHDTVQKELRRTLTALGLELTGNEDMTAMIQQQFLFQMSKMCQKNVLIPKVMALYEVPRTSNKEVQALHGKTTKQNDIIGSKIFGNKDDL
ncbi:HEAT repeat-containing protein 4 isoform X3 [Xenopus tropicalis]|uniref:HEAT repeat-containing protein 4 isoform X3 n=1 Tax=Xenopus tropicalis TaxID=8364 RepID=A0A8J1IQ04_XENTR|nr:HEAT repeat-containing protein 4 isoform X3 [Xenopus tropicalis]